jgi:hypothetical protein
METNVPFLLQRLLSRLNHAVRKSSKSWAGCFSEDSQGNLEEKYTAYVVEPGGVARNSKEIRALLLVLSFCDDSLRKGVFQHLVQILEISVKKKDPIFEKISIATSFILNGNFDSHDLRMEAARKILNFKERSYNGNDKERGTRILSCLKLHVRALQHSKVRSTKVPKRPKEKAEPTHEWLPPWQHQFLRESSSFEEEDDHISDLLSPSEVAFHFGR